MLVAILHYGAYICTGHGSSAGKLSVQVAQTVHLYMRKSTITDLIRSYKQSMLQKLYREGTSMADEQPSI